MKGSHGIYPDAGKIQSPFEVIRKRLLDIHNSKDLMNEGNKRWI